MKNVVLIVLVVIGLYWLLDHHAPLPLNHDSLHLYNHTVHRAIGVIFIVGAVLVGWLWKPAPQLQQ